VAFSGDGEPTHCPCFVDAVEAVVHLRASSRLPFFKLVLLTNASGLNRSEVKKGLDLFTPRDEIWAKLDAGTQEYMRKVNRTIARLTRFCRTFSQPAGRGADHPKPFSINRWAEPPSEEIEQYVRRLSELNQQGAQIARVQIYSATRPTCHSECGHFRCGAVAHCQRVRKSPDSWPKFSSPLGFKREEARSHASRSCAIPSTTPTRLLGITTLSCSAPWLLLAAEVTAVDQHYLDLEVAIRVPPS